MTDTTSLRTRALLGRWFWALVVVLAVVAVGTGWVAVSTYAFPGTTAEERVEGTWSTQAEVAHQATVESTNPIFPVGTTLEDRAVYYTAIAPVVDGEYRFSYAAPEGGDATIDSTVLVQIRSVGDEGETVYWETSRELADQTVDGVGPNEAVVVPFSLNASAVAEEADAIENSLGGSAGTLETRIVAWSQVEGTVGGSSVSNREVYAVPLSVDGGTYSFGEDGPWNDQYQDTSTVEVPRTYGPLRTIVSPVVALLALAGLGILLVFKRRGLVGLDTGERAELSYRRHRSNYDEWITRVKLPDAAMGDSRARVSTLEDLVDLAIDTDERVLEDPSRNRYFVQHDGVSYEYSPPVSIDSRE